MTMKKLIRKLDIAEFVREIETLVTTHNLEYLDAILHYCEQHDLEVESIATLVKKAAPILAKLEAQCIADRRLNVTPATSLDGFFSEIEIIE